MGCACETVMICVSGVTYPATVSYNANGSVRQATYIDRQLQVQTLAPETFTFGACAVLVDVFRAVQPLVAGNNVITHNLTSAPVEVEVRNNATGAQIAVRVVAETPTTTTIFVPVAVASARISIDA